MYTTLQNPWIDTFASKSSQNPQTEATFQSNKKWVKAEKLLETQGRLVALVRQSDLTNPPLMCHYRAIIKEIRFSSSFRNVSDKEVWIRASLTLQKEWIEEHYDSKKYDSWEEQFKDWELGDRAQTYFTLTDLSKLEPSFAITDLKKASNGQPLAPNFERGYSICSLPEHL
ncbi:hypothetical protein [Deinococcus sp.]|uniref:hypothetical protein n=1 Tax=Deinococcus sp. TaxID=47478 RepID=UPI003CC56CD3